ncbi:RdgB/HAM1 family non-canonical purine NTP pyrophosphatase [Spiroplasma sp. SV19]|uniref:RdgB/HAM1 family non-canonical purine NTP pyrophosphatase n=1 Tax=Spiroplasma sp. SV19 TaxID=2570468 RepID=UPI0024B74C55|nr:RdgB/HAM1 family non-canonical purine NTP pyrophosphatase [Spiroplasma sp. SV19]WHQ36653.1 RdgB/HAM1 family non-canonical purine NTP pyrophosphatase [Spiroplasma sp. SV19]
MKDIWIATSNKNKVREFNEMFQNVNITVKSLLDLEIPIPEIPETGTTFEENAFCKAAFLSQMINRPVLADDSGLEIIGLDHFPGINTRRWAYPITDNKIINDLLIEKCELLERRDAQAVCVLCYIDPLKKVTMYFRGVTKGVITDEPVGVNAFGYDPIFLLPEIGRTYAELTLTEKNNYSHRAKAFRAFKKWWLGE